jgi:hypothetical protein
MDKITTYKDKYRECYIELCYFEMSHGSWWTSYFTVLKTKVTSEVWEQLLLKPVSSDTWKTPHFSYGWDGLTANIDFHGGITFYEPKVDPATMEVWGVKLGCDYHHLHDEGRRYNLADVLDDIKASVDSFYVESKA